MFISPLITDILKAFFFFVPFYFLIWKKLNKTNLTESIENVTIVSFKLDLCDQLN